jgi:hypothetical protein
VPNVAVQVLDVVPLLDHEIVTLCVVAVDRAVELQDRGAFIRAERVVARV